VAEVLEVLDHCGKPGLRSTRIRLRWQGTTRFTWVVELVEGPVDWSPELHAAGTRSRMQRCAWGSPCTREARWSVRVKDKGGESWWAVCEEHRASSTVLNAGSR
jgi:hypothetical protein